jgi:hypothetical protein
LSKHLNVVGVLPKIAGLVAFFNQILENKANFCNYMVKINTFLGRAVAFFAEWWTGLHCRPALSEPVEFKWLSKTGGTSPCDKEISCAGAFCYSKLLGS